MVRSGMAQAPRWARWTASLADTLRTVAGFLDMQLHGRAMRRLEADVQALVALSLPILVHKRNNLSADPAAWRVERDFYIDRILWPSLRGSVEDPDRVRSRIAALVERQVAAASQAGERPAGIGPLPSVWQGETGWAS